MVINYRLMTINCYQASKQQVYQEIYINVFCICTPECAFERIKSTVHLMATWDGGKCIVMCCMCRCGTLIYYFVYNYSITDDIIVCTDACDCVS